MRYALVIVAYFLGAIPFGLLVTRLWVREDVRRIGSGNIGATNVARAAGKRAAALVLLLDVLKGFVPSTVALGLLAPGMEWWVAGVGFAAFLGHVFPIYLHFRGGKGVATALGICLALIPIAALVGACVYIVVFIFSRTSSLGSLSAAIGTTAVSFGLAASPAYAWLALAMVLLIVLRHRSNIDRLLGRREARL